MVQVYIMRLSVGWCITEQKPSVLLVYHLRISAAPDLVSVAVQSTVSIKSSSRRSFVFVFGFWFCF